MRNKLILGFKISCLIPLLAVATPLLAYVTQRSLSTTGEIVSHRWKSMPITWSMNPVRGSNVTGAREQAEVVRQSFQAWSSLTTASISFTEGAATAPEILPAYDGVNVVTTNLTREQYVARGGGDALALTISSFFDQAGVDPLGRTIDFPGQVIEADIMFNPAIQFTTSSTAVADRIDFQAVATHEIGHLLGLDHTSIVASTMFPTVGEGFIYPRTLSTDDIAGVSTIYPAASFASKGTISGTVRTTANVPVYGAIVTAVNSNGQPVASAITNPSGQYTMSGLDAGAYTVYAEPMDAPLSFGSVAGTLLTIYPGQTVNTGFTTRFR